MTNRTNSRKTTTVLDVSKSLGYGFLYHPVIGKTAFNRYPLATRFRIARLSSINRRFLKKTLV